MLFEDIKNITSLPEYKAYIKALKDENREAETKNLRKLIQEIGERKQKERARKIENKVTDLSYKQTGEVYKKQFQEVEKIENKYDEILRNCNGEEWQKNFSKMQEEIGKAYKKYEPKKTDVKKAERADKEKAEKYLNRFHRKDLLDTVNKRESQKNKKENEVFKMFIDLEKKYLEDDKTFQKTCDSLKKINKKENKIKVFGKHDTTYWFKAEHEDWDIDWHLNRPYVSLGKIYWKIKSQTLTDQQWEKFDNYLRKNLLNILCKENNINKGNLEAIDDAHDHDFITVVYILPKEDINKLDPEKAAKNAVGHNDMEIATQKKYKKEFRKKYSDILKDL